MASKVDPTRIEAGQLRHRIRIEKPTDTQGETFGEARIDSWTIVGEFWAGYEQLNGREQLNNDKLGASQTGIWTMRHIDGITERMRLKHGCDVFNIDSINNVNRRNKKLELTCTLVTS